MIEQALNVMGYAVLLSATLFTVTAEVYATVLVIKAIKKTVRGMRDDCAKVIELEFHGTEEMEQDIADIYEEAE